MSSEIQAIRVDHLQINVTDLPRARRFYEGILGLVETGRPASFDFAGCWYRVGEVDVHLVVREAEPVSQRHFCLWVKDVHAAANFIEAQGVGVRWDVRYKIRGVDRFFVFDPDSNRIEIQGSDGTGESRWDT
jgi:catechol 2,3-dioxygenase-like lactoylglutathione lyase family enzyme